MDILLLAVVTYLVIATIGYAIHKYLRMPWMFTVVVLGMAFSALGLFKGVMGSANFQFLSRMGMLFFFLPSALIWKSNRSGNWAAISSSGISRSR